MAELAVPRLCKTHCLYLAPLAMRLHLLWLIVLPQTCGGFIWMLIGQWMLMHVFYEA